MPTRLHRLYGCGHLHFITFSCYARCPLLDTPVAKNIFVETLSEIRKRYRFKLVGYVVMPEHLHLLISEPEVGDPSNVLMALKYRVARDLRGGRPISKTPLIVPGAQNLRSLPRFWQHRFYDFNVYTRAKQREKLEYMHSNPVTRGLVMNPGAWIWSSYLFYQAGEWGIIQIDPVD
jgi:REP-associated tyrosine transposase